MVQFEHALTSALLWPVAILVVGAVIVTAHRLRAKKIITFQQFADASTGALLGLVVFAAFRWTLLTYLPFGPRAARQAGPSFHISMIILWFVTLAAWAGSSVLFIRLARRSRSGTINFRLSCAACVATTTVFLISVITRWVFMIYNINN